MSSRAAQPEPAQAPRVRPRVRTMLAAVAEPGSYRFRLRRVAVPRAGPGEALVCVQAASVTRGLLAMWHFTDNVKLLPAVLGHEIAGVVAELGDGDGDGRFAPGDRVRVHPTVTCGACARCRAGEASLCSSQFTIGYASTRPASDREHARYHHGGLAEFVRVPAGNLDPVPAGVSSELAAKAGTLANSLRAVRAATRAQRDTVVITAASGGSGAAAVRCARMAAVAGVIGVGTSAAALERLSGPDGLTHAIATERLGAGWRSRDALSAAIRRAAGGGGPGAVVDFMPFGADVTVQAIRSMRPGGRAVLAGGNVSALALPYLDVMRNQYEIRGLRGNRREDEREVLAALADGRLVADDLVTHSFPLREANRAVDTVMRRSLRPMFVVVRP